MVWGTSEYGERLIVVLMGEDMTPIHFIKKICKLKLAIIPRVCEAFRIDVDHQ